MGLICFGIFYGQRFQGPRNPGTQELGQASFRRARHSKTDPQPQPLPAIPFTRPIVLENTATLAALAALAALAGLAAACTCPRGILCGCQARACD